MGQRKAQTRLWICAVPQGHLLFAAEIPGSNWTAPCKQKYFLEIISRSEKIYNPVWPSQEGSQSLQTIYIILFINVQ